MTKTDGWRLHGSPRHSEVLVINEQSVKVTVTRRSTLSYDLQADDASWPAPVYLQFHPKATGSHTAPELLDISLNGERLRVSAYRHIGHADHIDLFTAQGHVRVQRVDPLRQVGTSHAAAGRLTALMPGKVVAMLVKEGQAIKQGDPLAVTEAMKMEHTLTSPKDGVVSAILCAVGDQVAEGVELLRIE